MSARSVVRPPVAALALANALVLLTGAVRAGGFPVPLDRWIAAHTPGLHATGVPGAVMTAASLVTGVATPYVAVAVTVAASYRLRRADRSLVRSGEVVRPLAALVVSVVLGKIVVHRTGPLGTRLHVFGYFPSGHTATALVCSWMLAAFAARRRPGWRRRLQATAVGWTLLVAAGLVVHRYHWLSDTVGGVLLGSLVLVTAGPSWRGRRATAEPSASRY